MSLRAYVSEAEEAIPSPASTAILLSTAVRLRERREYRPALAFLRSLDASIPKVQFEIGCNLAMLCEPAAALPYLYGAARKLPDSWGWIGYCLHGLGRFDEAIEVYKNRAPRTEDTVNAIAAVYYDTAQWDKAFDCLLTCPEPRSPVTKQNLAHIHLGRGEWTVGWSLYRSRHQAFGEEKAQEAANLVNSLDELRGQRVLVCSELGRGDIIQFWRWLPKLADIASDLTLWVYPELAALFTAQGVCRVITDMHEASGMLRAGWKHTRIMDLPGLFDVLPDRIPSASGYLSIPPEAIARRALPATGKRRVGLCWQGSIRPAIPFEELAPLLALADTYQVEFYSLQMPTNHRDHPRLNRVLADDYDYLDSAAIITQLDLVISVDTSVAHLTGALGKPIWLVNRFDSCWRWGWRTDFNWYDQMLIYRSEALNDWRDIIALVARDLRLFVETW